jgi:hypothetical protein
MATGEPPPPPPSPELPRSFLGQLMLVLVVAVVAIYLSMVWYDARQGEQRRAVHAARPAASAASAAAAARPSQAPASQPASVSTGAVTKCVQGDRTTYSDAACPPGAAGTPLAIYPRQNLADGLPREQVAPAAPASSAPRSAANEADLRTLRCEALAARIRHIDIEARQALPQPRQDDLQAERKKARDEQTRLRC